MKFRKGIQNIIRNRIRSGQFGWLLRQGFKYFFIRRAAARGSGRVFTGPIAAHFFITTRCNLHCPMCIIPQRAQGPEMDTGETSSLIRALAEIGTSGVCFTGGEPFLRKDIFQLVNLCRALKLPTVLVTNGTLLEDRLDELLQAAPTVVNISIDGSTSEIHEQSHVGKGVFVKTLRGLRLLSGELKKKNGPSTTITISTVVSGHNRDDLDNIISLARDAGADRIVFIPLHHNNGEWCGVQKDSKIPPVSRYLLNHPARDFIENSDYFLSNLDGLFAGRPLPLVCTAGYTTIIVGPDKRIYPCKGYFEVGKAAFDPRRDGSELKDIWSGRQYRSLRRELSACDMCAFPCNREFDPLFSGPGSVKRESGR